MTNIPNATPMQLIDLIDKGLGVQLLTRDGNAMDHSFGGPSTNIVQTNFTGLSNMYTPFLYFDKGTTEKFL